uniref:(northern house mosquito) hypothetical protein n=1 Tax=Culex pipiens TaxID=7175 RepID=A0A8D7ZYI0_CULPI
MGTDGPRADRTSTGGGKFVSRRFPSRAAKKENKQTNQRPQTPGSPLSADPVYIDNFTLKLSYKSESFMRTKCRTARGYSVWRMRLCACLPFLLAAVSER